MRLARPLLNPLSFKLNKNLKTLNTLTLLGAVVACSSVLANNFSDADAFGGIDGTGKPNGVTLNAAVPGQGSVTGTFDFVNPDGTSFFQTYAPYAISDQDPFFTQLGFLVGTDTTVSGRLSLFFRDPLGGAETVTYSSQLLSQQIVHGSFTTQLKIAESINGTVAGLIDANGNISYTITAASGSFILDGAYMEIETVRRNVPDGGATSMLLGLGTLGLGLMRRKMA
jgi:hypothetical protein